MTGTEAAEDDELFVLTAVLLTPAQFPSVLGDDFPAACAALGLEPLGEGYGLVLGQDGAGARWTVAVDDVSLVAVAIASWDCGMEYDLSPPERSVVTALPGWPLALAVATPDIPAPHDPEPDEDDPDGAGLVLTPPDTDAWGPAQRRLGADEIARQWAVWRGQLDEESDTGTFEGTGGELRPAVRRVIDALHGYVAEPPPVGRVRSAFASSEARTLRADGPGWSFVARTDDIAFLLLDEEPGEVLTVGRGEELPGLLESLDKIAVRPA
ncbi:hypothetical protein ACFYVL_33075 [Streptomyces sp. NPDC004111]|uniref:hypothetical protein n=1 Tax=Streptomyces sp. NPDC004111 TaxID=3364690 RepID=UPI0036BE8E8C